MVRAFKFLLFTLGVTQILQAAPQQTPEPLSQKAASKFEISTFKMSANDEIYKIFTAKLKGQNEFKNVLFLLDANAQFNMLLNEFDGKAAPLIIGIGYDSNKSYEVEKRTRDLTPKAEGEEFSKGGGADAFYHFLTKNLVPLIDEKFNVQNSQKSLYGHSFGGLFTLYVLLKNEGVFSNFFIASPSLWWGESEILKQNVSEGKFKEKVKAKFVFLSVGELEKRKGKTDKAGILKASDLAGILKQSGVNSNFELFKNETHGSVIPQHL
ncbi:alpha/beta hydrolase, partial [Campylobacter concisus]|uniref:alpha/beta hydrolase n=1 Tax=Campylobacter concisus TaxID=199 RepID=UPI000CD8683F